MLHLKDPSLLKQQAFLNGAWCDADNGHTHTVTDPATGAVIGSVPAMGAAETRRAIAAANAAWPGWRAKTAKERSAILRNWNDLMLANADDLARIMTLEQGKPLAEAQGRNRLRGVLSSNGSPRKASASTATRCNRPGPTSRIVVIKEPIGVCAAITPWNFPAAMITRKVGPALAAGCTIVVKPAEATPFSALRAGGTGRARRHAGRRVLSVVTGDAPAIGGELTANPIVRKLTLHRLDRSRPPADAAMAPTIKKVSLELGGNAPFIVFDDADLDAAVEGAMVSKYRNTGQTCVCANRLYVQDGVYDAFADKLVAAVAKLKVGNGLEPASRKAR